MGGGGGRGRGGGGREREKKRDAESALNVKKYTAENKLHRRCALTVRGAFMQQYASIASIQQVPDKLTPWH
jgi:hypothetical protein